MTDAVSHLKPEARQRRGPDSFLTAAELAPPQLSTSAQEYVMATSEHDRPEPGPSAVNAERRGVRPILIWSFLLSIIALIFVAIAYL